MFAFRYKPLQRIRVFSTAFALALSAGLYGCNQGAPFAGSQLSPITLPGEGVAIYAAGDIAQCKNFKPANTNAAKTAALIVSALVKDQDAAVLTLGDTTYPVGLPVEFNNCYDPTWGQFKERTFPSPGNHDYYTPGAIGYFGYFGSAAGPERRGYFSMTIGKWHVVSLNSNLRDEDSKTQLAWLRMDLAQHETRCTLAYWHHPLFSSGGHGNNANMKEAWQVLEAAGADVVLAGHDHNYERFAPQDSEGRRNDGHGIREFVVGTGGAALSPIGFPKSNSETGDNSTHGVLKIVLKETGYEWEFLPVLKGGFSDRGAALCH